MQTNDNSLCKQFCSLSSQTPDQLRFTISSESHKTMLESLINFKLILQFCVQKSPKVHSSIKSMTSLVSLKIGPIKLNTITNGTAAGTFDTVLAMARNTAANGT